MSISKKTWLGVAREATAGTMQASPTLYMPASVKFQNKKARIYFQEDRNTRDGNNSVVDGTRHSEGSISGAWYNDSSVYALLAFMGADTPTQPAVSTDPTVWQHALALTDNPLPLDFWLGYDSADLGFAYTMAYNVVKSCKFTWESTGNKGFEFSASTLGQPFTKITTGIPVPTYSTLQPLPGYAPVIQFTGSQSNDIEHMEIDLEQKYTLFNPSNGSASWVTAYPGERTAKISFKARFDSDALYQKYAVNTGVDDAIVVTVNGPTISHTYTEQLVLTFPIVGYDDMEHDISKDNIMISGKATVRPGSAVNSLFSATVQNTIASYAI